MPCGLSRKIKVLLSLQRVRMDWFQFKREIAAGSSLKGELLPGEGAESGAGCIKQPVRVWGVLCQVPELGLGVLALLGLWE